MKSFVLILVPFLFVFSGCDYESLWSGVDITGTIDTTDKLSGVGYYRDKFKIGYMGNCSFTLAANDGVPVMLQHYDVADNLLYSSSADEDPLYYDVNINITDYFYVAVHKNSSAFINNGSIASYTINATIQ